ncbi:hypothetical protein WR25_00261 [Diploscapter pachys]|uniref:Trimethylguanosine synthase n=1 Tax=Diploscapter pachys TaxID=2018661 RepID=A0A2A2JR19_9BILA|nr:hypothetical protein WR25_00261 [Diploscapter pachys]
MEEGQEANQESYLFPWFQLATLSLDYRPLLDSRSSPTPCTSSDLSDYLEVCFSRAILKDMDLMKKSEADRFLNDAKELKEDVNNLERDVKTMDLSNREQQVATHADLLEVDDSESDVWASLPKQFGAMDNCSRKSTGVGGKKRKISTVVLEEMSTEEYWETAKAFLVQKTWLIDYGNLATEEKRAELEKFLTQNRPFALLEEHKNLEENPNYRGLTTGEKYEKASMDERYAAHCDLVKTRVKLDFSIYKSGVLRNKCNGFFKKIQKIGFTTDPEKLNIVMGNTLNALNDMSFEYYGNGFETTCVLNMKRKENTDSAATMSSTNSESTDLNSSAEPMDSGSTEQNLDQISFAFDPEKDAHLVASNAAQYYKNDQEIRKYYYQRYRLFTKIDSGVLLDREGWFSVTPERLAEHIADRVVRQPGMIVVDAFAGVGGNSIQFALKGAKVIAIDLDPVRLKCAKRNAEVYGVADRIDFICTNFFHFASLWTKDGSERPAIDAVFLSPPWGGPSYLQSKEFDLNVGLVPNGYDIYNAAAKISPNIAYFLPRHTKVEQLIELSGLHGKCEIEQGLLNKKIKVVTAYYGSLAA